MVIIISHYYFPPKMVIIISHYYLTTFRPFLTHNFYPSFCCLYTYSSRAKLMRFIYKNKI
jgi:hypothetical protein